MRKQAIFDVTISGRSIGSLLAPCLTSITVEDKAGTTSDTASIEIDDAGAKIAFPEAGAPIKISLGWLNTGMREVFSGTVDEVKSTGSRSGGMMLSITAKGFDATGKIKQGQERHFDQKTVKDIITDAGKAAGLTKVEVDPQLADVVIPYIDMRGESLLHFGQRLARMVGASFRVQGDRVTVARRAADYSPTIRAERGINLHSWDVTPVIGRARFKKVKARYFDKAKGKVETVEAEVDADALTDAEFFRRELAPDKAEAERAAQSDAAVAKEKGGGGSVVIEGAPDAIPDAMCVIAGARPGVDGSYRIKGVSHSYTRGGGYTTTLELAHPQGEAGKDRRAAKPGTGSTGPTDYKAVIGEMSGEAT